MTLTNSAFNLNVYGSLILPPANLTTAFSSTGFLYFKSTTIGNTITSGGVARNWNGIYFDGVGGEWTNLDDWSTSTTIRLTNGTWNTNSKTITCSVFGLATGVKTLILGNSVITAPRFQMIPSLGLTMTPHTATINCEYSNYFGGKTYGGTVNLYRSSGTVNLTIIDGDNTFNNLSISIGAITLYSQLGGNNTVTGTLTLTGYNSTSNRLLLASTPDGTQRTITAENILASNVDFRDINLQGNCIKDLSAISGGARDLGNNSNIRFSPSLKKKGRQLGYNIGSKKQANNGVQIGDQIWTAKNYNESTVGSLVIPEVQNNTNTELITNIADREFSSDTGFWNKTQVGVTISGGTLNWDGTTGSGQGIHRPNLLIINRWYKVTFSILNINTGAIRPYMGAYSTESPSTVGTYTIYMKSLSTSFYLFSTGANIVSVDNISIELIGWASLDTIPTASDRVAWSNYNNLQTYGDVYGKLYNWYAVNEINNQLVATNSDWRVPTSAQHTTLQTNLGGYGIAGGKMKELGLLHWNSPNLKADNISGFNLLGGGQRASSDGDFEAINAIGSFWSLDEYRTYVQYHQRSSYIQNLGAYPSFGTSLRLIKK